MRDLFHEIVLGAVGLRGSRVSRSPKAPQHPLPCLRRVSAWTSTLAARAPRPDRGNRPTAIRGDVGDDYRLGAVRGRPARTHGRSDDDAVDCLGVRDWQAGRGAVPKPVAVRLEQQDRRQRTAGQFFDEAAHGIEDERRESPLAIISSSRFSPASWSKASSSAALAWCCSVTSITAPTTRCCPMPRGGREPQHGHT